MKTLIFALILIPLTTLAEPSSIDSIEGFSFKEKIFKEYLEIKGQGTVSSKNPLELKVQTNLDKKRLEKGQVLGFIKEEGSMEILVLRYEKNNVFKSYKGTTPTPPTYGKKIEIVLQVPLITVDKP